MHPEHSIFKSRNCSLNEMLTLSMKFPAVNSIVNKTNPGTTNLKTAVLLSVAFCYSTGIEGSISMT